MVAVPEADVELARAAMFARHPQMAAWPEGHHFTLWVVLCTWSLALGVWGQGEEWVGWMAGQLWTAAVDGGLLGALQQLWVRCCSCECVAAAQCCTV